MIKSIDKVHLKCDCVDGSIVNGIRDQMIFSFNFETPPGYKHKKTNHCFVKKDKQNKSRQDPIFY